MTEAVVDPQASIPGPTETPLELFVFRPVSELLVRLFLPMPLSDIGLTVLGIAVGIGGASLFRFTSGTNVVAGCMLMVLYLVINRAGAGVAQVRGTSSRLGWILSVLSDYVVGIAFAVVLSVHLDKLDIGWGPVVAVAGMVSVLLQGMVFDYFRNRYLALSNPGAPSGNDLDETLEAIEELRKKGGSGIVIAIHQVYAGLRKAQVVIGDAFGLAPFLVPSTREDAKAYAERLALPARVWALLGPSTHIALMTLCAVVGGLPGYIWVRLIVGNLLLVGLYFEHYRRERGILGKLGI